MKQIVICFDGTSNRHDAAHQTNVVLMARAVAQNGFGDAVPLVQYHTGVGSGRGTNRVSKAMDRMLGGAMALGLVDVVEEAYRALAFAYERGDALYVFGFSRGAFTARVFAGLLRSCGIPVRSTLQSIPEALARHFSPTKPDDPESIAFRRRFAPETATSAKELVMPGRREDGAIPLEIAYMGLWDTVKSLARPQRVAGVDHPVPRLFHDLDLSAMVQSARHAIAIDERRALYPVWPFTNFPDLNARRPAPAHDPVPRYQQVWFPGDHGSVGGGGNRVGLSSIAFRWVALGAAKAGLRLLPDDVTRLCWRMDPGDALTNRLAPGGPLAFVLSRLQDDRRGPEAVQALLVAALDRWCRDTGYRPRTLRKITPLLDAMTDGERDALRAALMARDGGETHRPGDPWWLPWPDVPPDMPLDQPPLG